MKGSGSIGDDADEGILLYRPRNKDETEKVSMEPTCTVFVEKSRFSSGGQALLYFNGSKARFDEIKEKKNTRKISSMF
jgi:replicative DNA helicase